MNWVSKNSTSGRNATYLSHPNYLPTNQEVLLSMLTHRIDKDEQNRNLEGSAEWKWEDWLTKSYSHVEAKAVALGMSDTSNMKSRCWGSIPDWYRTSRTSQRLRIQDCVYHRQHSAVPEPWLTIYGNRSMTLNACPWTLNFIHSNIHFIALFIETWKVHIHMILPTFLWSFPYSLRGSIKNSSCMGSTASSLHKHDLFRSSSTVVFL